MSIERKIILEIILKRNEILNVSKLLKKDNKKSPNKWDNM